MNDDDYLMQAAKLLAADRSDQLLSLQLPPSAKAWAEGAGKPLLDGVRAEGIVISFVTGWSDEFMGVTYL